MSAQFPTLAEVLLRADMNHPTYGTPEFADYQADMWREACTVRTVEQLDALPLNTVVVDAVGIPRTKRHGDSHMPGGWTHAGRSPLRSRELADGRDMVIVWHPSWAQP